jgi:hypothetical protein
VGGGEQFAEGILPAGTQGGDVRCEAELGRVARVGFAIIVISSVTTSGRGTSADDGRAFHGAWRQSNTLVGHEPVHRPR